MKYTTSRLRLELKHRYLIHEASIRHALEGMAFLTALVLISRLLAPPAPVVQLAKTTTSQPIVVIQRETQAPLPTYTPAPVPTAVVIVEQAPAPEPQVIYVQAPPVAAQDAPQQAEAAAPVVDDVAPTPEVLCDERCLNIQGHYVEPPHLQTFAVLPGDEISPALLREAQDK